MMTLNDYWEPFRRNLMLMSRAENGAQDFFAAAEKMDAMAVANPEETDPFAFLNTSRALEYLYENRRRPLNAEKDAEDLILRTAEIVNGGVKQEYVKVKDIPQMWRWFIKTFYWMLTSSCFEPEEIAAFCEYFIHMGGHFFFDGCERISMLISAYVFMRFDLPCVEYHSREEYYRVSERIQTPTVESVKYFLGNVEFENFLSYYLSLCPSRENSFYSYYEKRTDGEYVFHLIGSLVREACGNLQYDIEAFYEKYGDMRFVFDCGALRLVSVEGAEIFRKMKSVGRRFELINLSVDCMVLLKAVGLEDCLEAGRNLPQIDLSQCAVLGGGKNGIVYRVSDEMVAKTFRHTPDYNDIIRERVSQRNALISGIPAPFSFGYAEDHGKLMTLMEMVNSESLTKKFLSEEERGTYIVKYARMIKMLHGIQSKDKLRLFPKNFFGNDILAKADRVDSVLPEQYRGKARQIIEGEDEPECLVHGDIQPGNIMISGDEMLFIDFDTFSTGKGIYDLGALFRTLYADIWDMRMGFSSYLQMSTAICEELWNGFFRAYYQGESERVLRRKDCVIRVIGYVLMLSKSVKYKNSPEKIGKHKALLEEAIDAYESCR